MPDLTACANCHQQVADALNEAKFWRDFALLQPYAVRALKVVVAQQPRPAHADDVDLFPHRPKAEGHL